LSREGNSQPGHWMKSPGSWKPWTPSRNRKSETPAGGPEAFPREVTRREVSWQRLPTDFSSSSWAGLRRLLFQPFGAGCSRGWEESRRRYTVDAGEPVVGGVLQAAARALHQNRFCGGLRPPETKPRPNAVRGLCFPSEAAGSQRRQEVKTAPRVLGIERPWMASAGRSLLLTLRNLLLFPGLGLA